MVFDKKNPMYDMKNMWEIKGNIVVSFWKLWYLSCHRLIPKLYGNFCEGIVLIWKLWQDILAESRIFFGEKIKRIGIYDVKFVVILLFC